MEKTDEMISAINECNEQFQAPDVIWLQPDEFPEITWCRDKINDNDIKYLLATPERKAAGDMIQVLNDNLSGYRNLIEMELLPTRDYDKETQRIIDRIEAVLELAKGASP